MTKPAKKKTPARSASDREMVLSRVLDAPRERVWEAWADPEQVAAWWGPSGFTTTTQHRVMKAGGEWRHTMTGPDGVDYPNHVRFEEVVEPERIVYTNEGAKKGEYDVRFRTTVTFKAVGGKTEITMRSVFDTMKMRELVVKKFGAIEGGRQTLSRLASHLAGEFVLFRLVDAPRERVWKAWTDPAQLQAWFGPKDFETFHARLEFRPGGVYHYGIRNSAGLEVWGKWTFREIVAPERLVFLQAFSDKDGGLGRHPLSPEWPQKMLATILFGDFGGKTLITIKWLPYEATEIERKTFGAGFAGMRQGWGGTFARLDEHLKAPTRSAPMNASVAAVVTTPTDREIRTERIFNASRERVWRAFTDPKQLARWWGRGHKLVIERMEVERGGHWRYVEHAPDGVHGFEGRYREVALPERLAQTFEWDGMPGHVCVTTATFEDLGGGRTRVVTTVLFHTPEERDGMLTAGMSQGLNQSYAALDRLLAKGTKENR